METTETPIAPSPEPTPPAPETAPPPEENLVGEAKRKQRQAERAEKEARDQLEALQDRDRSEVEKAQKRAEKAEQLIADLEGKTKRLERGGWLHNAAAEAGFHDPADAIAHAKLDEIEDEREAKRFVKNLAESKKHLLKPEDGPPRELGQVLRAGEKPEPNQPEKNEWAEGLATKLKQVSESNRL